MRVYLAGKLEDGVLTRLQELVAANVEVHDEHELPYDVLVAGVPTEEQLDARPALRAVVIPWAGVAARTWERVRARPPLALYNLHHNAAATAEMAMALFLAAAKGIVPADRALRAGDWGPRYAEQRGLGCDGTTALVLGYGAIGKRIAAACRALGMEVHAVRRQPAGDRDGAIHTHASDALHDLLPRAHACFVALPWTPATEGLLDAAALALLPDRAVVVNVGRGRIVAEQALYDELATGRLSAGLDVWYEYPPSRDEAHATAPSRFPFGELDNVVLSPHRGGHVAQTAALRTEHLARLLNALAAGKEPPGRVDLEYGY